MCTAKTPDIPEPPPPLQAVKQPELNTSARDRKRTVNGGGSLLTGPGGVTSGALTTGATTLLGG